MNQIPEHVKARKTPSALNLLPPKLATLHGEPFISQLSQHDPGLRRRHRIRSRLPDVGAPVCGLRKEEQDLLHGLVLPSGGHRCGRALQHCLLVAEESTSIFLRMCCPSTSRSSNQPDPKNSTTQVLCVHSLLEHTDVTIMYDNEALYDICRRHMAENQR